MSVLIGFSLGTIMIEKFGLSATFGILLLLIVVLCIVYKILNKE